MQFDWKIRCSKLEPGDYVLVCKKGFTGKHKIRDRWELHSYWVISKHEVDIPVFLVESCGKDGKQKVLHRNMLFPLNNKIESDHKQISDEIVEFIEQTDSQLSVEDSDRESLEEEPTYQGPMTQSHMQALMKANLVMMIHFSEDYIFKTEKEDMEYPLFLS